MLFFMVKFQISATASDTVDTAPPFTCSALQQLAFFCFYYLIWLFIIPFSTIQITFIFTFYMFIIAFPSQNRIILRL